MAKNRKKNPNRRPHVQGARPCFLGPKILVGLAILPAAYLAYSSLQEGGIAGCGPGSGCDAVLSSRWAYLFGFPVSLAAVVAYAALVTGLGMKPRHAVKGPIEPWVGGLAGLVVMAALWFTGIQAFVLKTFCPFCLTTHALAGTGSFWALILSRHSTGAWRKPALAIALAGAAAVVAGPYVNAPATYRAVETAEAVASPAETGPTARTLSLYDGAIVLPLDELPVSGATNATHHIVGLFDYTCKHCRQMHHDLEIALKAFPDELAVVDLPMPLDRTCNDLLARRTSENNPAHATACEFARIGLAVWRARPEAFRSFHEWAMGLAQTPPIGLVHTRAERLIGAEALREALTDPWIDERIRQDVALYETNYNTHRDSKMPQLLVGSRFVVGNFRNINELFTILEQEWGLTRPTAP